MNSDFFLYLSIIIILNKMHFLIVIWLRSESRYVNMYMKRKENKLLYTLIYYYILIYTHLLLIVSVIILYISCIVSKLYNKINQLYKMDFIEYNYNVYKDISLILYISVYIIKMTVVCRRYFKKNIFHVQS